MILFYTCTQCIAAAVRDDYNDDSEDMQLFFGEESDDADPDLTPRVLVLPTIC